MLSYAAKDMGGAGWAFGLHEALDSTGAVLGPLIAALVLFLHGGYRHAFAWLLLPAIGALATLAITVASDGKAYASIEACSMIAGAVALGLYAWLTMQLIVRWRWHGLTAALIALAVWFGCALGIWLGVLR